MRSRMLAYSVAWSALRIGSLPRSSRSRHAARVSSVPGKRALFWVPIDVCKIRPEARSTRNRSGSIWPDTMASPSPKQASISATSGLCVTGCTEKPMPEISLATMVWTTTATLKGPVPYPCAAPYESASGENAERQQSATRAITSPGTTSRYVSSWPAQALPVPSSHVALERTETRGTPRRPSSARRGSSIDLGIAAPSSSFAISRATSGAPRIPCSSSRRRVRTSPSAAARKASKAELPTNESRRHGNSRPGELAERRSLAACERSARRGQLRERNDPSGGHETTLARMVAGAKPWHVRGRDGVSERACRRSERLPRARQRRGRCSPRWRRCRGRARPGKSTEPSRIPSSSGIPVASAVRTRPLKIPTILAASMKPAGPTAARRAARASGASARPRLTASPKRTISAPWAMPPSPPRPTVASSSARSPRASLLARSSITWEVVQ